MYWLIETEEQISYLINRGFKEAFIEIIPFSNDVHPALNDISLVYFKPSIEKKGFMLCIDHSETLSIKKTQVDKLLQGIERLYVQDKKNALYYFPIKGLLDVNLITHPYIPEPTPTHTILSSRLKHRTDINRMIPVVKHYEVSETTYNAIKHTFDAERPPYFEFYNNYATLALFGIEKNGIKTDPTLFEQYFGQKTDQAFTRYNFYTTTTRPSNTFGGVNFAALNKDNGCRKSFIPENDEFVELDISAYHPNLAASLVAMDFGGQDIHQAFSEMYGTSYKEAKELTFKQLYGGIFKEYEHLEFFQKVKTFIDNNWDEFNNLGRVVVPKSGYWFEKSKLDNMNPQKLFNYVLQNLETATNVCILMHIHKLLKGKKTKIVLYTYDSFLFDFANEEHEVLEDIKNIFKKFELNTKVAHGTSYDFTGN